MNKRGTTCEEKIKLEKGQGRRSESMIVENGKKEGKQEVVLPYGLGDDGGGVMIGCGRGLAVFTSFFTHS